MFINSIQSNHTYNSYICRLVGVVCIMHGYDGKKLGHGSQDNYGAMTLETDRSMTSEGVIN